jgi:hypothetical protein
MMIDVSEVDHVNGELKPLVELLALGIKHDILIVLLLFYDVTRLKSEVKEMGESGLSRFIYSAPLSQNELAVAMRLLKLFCRE